MYVCAFASLWVQVEGLLGAQGIRPAAELLGVARERLGGWAFYYVPTLLWLTGASDLALNALCALGVTAGLSLAFLWAPRAGSFAAWLLYLSLVVVGEPFTSFQWDMLLLEAGVVGWLAASAEARLGVWLARGLLWKLMFLSGAVKLLSGDPTWRDLSALSYHYWTQPLPSPLAPFAASAPLRAQQLATAVTLAVELLAPWGILGPRRVRLGAGALLVGLQVLIALTGNYGFFNLLTVVLCVTLFVDPPPPRETRLRIPLRAAAAALAFASAVVALERLTPRGALPVALRALVAPIEPLRSVSSYGLFAVMTTERPEIQIEGSADGVTWLDYEPRWKPDALDRAPRFTGPHMPRVDWQLWFAALGSCQHETWLHELLLRLLEGSPPVRSLFANDPFPAAPPRYLRTTLWQYRFGRERWWERSDPRTYCPIVTLRDGQLALANDLEE